MDNTTVPPFIVEVLLIPLVYMKLLLMAMNVVLGAMMVLLMFHLVPITLTSGINAHVFLISVPFVQLPVLI